MFEAYLLGKHRFLNHWWTNNYAFLSKRKLALGFAIHDPS